MTWFDDLTGFRETSPDKVRENLIVEGEKLTSLANGKVYHWGRLETPSLAELRKRVQESERREGRITLHEVVADVQALHTSESNTGALFQVASQFNLLEMVSPNVTPEQGVGRYEHDHTQGPACAIAAGAGTVYRNYFVHVEGQTGQSSDKQIDCLADIGAALGNTSNRLWEMRNGYALATNAGLIEISNCLRGAREDEIDTLRQRLRIGIQWDTQVTMMGCRHTVTQAYCSALPVAYSSHPPALWEGFARLILEASYEATLGAAILNSLNNGNKRVYLTLLGGGAFGNATEWILDALRRALKLYTNAELDAAIVSYGASRPAVRQLVEQF